MKLDPRRHFGGRGREERSGRSEDIPRRRKEGALQETFKRRPTPMYYCRHTHRGILYLLGVVFFSFSIFLALTMVFPRGPFKPSGPFLQRVVAASLIISPFRHQALFLTMKFSSFGDASHSLKGGPSTSLLSNQLPRSTFCGGGKRESENVCLFRCGCAPATGDTLAPTEKGGKGKRGGRRRGEVRGKRCLFPLLFPCPSVRFLGARLLWKKNHRVAIMHVLYYTSSMYTCLMCVFRAYFDGVVKTITERICQ